MSNVSFKGATLVDVLMPRVILGNVDFSDAKLTNVRLSTSSILYSNFDGSVLDNVEIIGSYFLQNNFKNSEIKNMIFNRAVIINSDFSETEFKNTTFEQNIFEMTDFTDVDFSSIKIKRGVAFADSLFTNSNISDYELYETDFSEKSISRGCHEFGIQDSTTRDKFYDPEADTGTCFIPASNLSGLNLSKTDLSDVVFSKITSSLSM
jgi:uncharacterized protein YjbI with pentapeptide repeats